MACRWREPSEDRLTAASAPRWPLRAWMRLAAIALLLGLFLPLHGLWRLFGRRSPWPRAFLKAAARACGMVVTTSGTSSRHDVLYVANHSSWLDILVLAGATGTAFVATADMIDWPVLGWMAGLNNTVFVARDQRRDVSRQADALRAALATHQPLALFPEGTTGDGVALLPFRSSLLAAVTPPPPGIAIQPVAIDYGADARMIAWTGNEGIGANAMRVLDRPGRVACTIRFGMVLTLAEPPDRKTIARVCRDAIAALLGHPSA